VLISRWLLFLCFSTLRRLPRQAYLTYRGAPAPRAGINPITPVWWDIKPGRFVPARSAHSINTTIKNPARSDYVGVSNRRWQNRSPMWSRERAGAARAVHRRGEILYIGHVDNRPVHRRVIEGCMRGRKQGNVKPARGRTKANGGRHGELTNRSAINMLILLGNRGESGNQRNCIVIMAHAALSSRIVCVNRRLINAK